jgi:hypothetical protein
LQQQQQQQHYQPQQQEQCYPQQQFQQLPTYSSKSTSNAAQETLQRSVKANACHLYSLTKAMEAV